MATVITIGLRLWEGESRGNIVGNMTLTVGFGKYTVVYCGNVHGWVDTIHSTHHLSMSKLINSQYQSTIWIHFLIEVNGSTVSFENHGIFSSFSRKTSNGVKSCDLCLFQNDYIVKSLQVATAMLCLWIIYRAFWEFLLFFPVIILIIILNMVKVSKHEVNIC